MNGHNDFDKLKQYLFNKIYNDRVRCKKMQNVIVYNFSPKYDCILYKWYKKFNKKQYYLLCKKTRLNRCYLIKQIQRYFSYFSLFEVLYM